MNNRYSFKKIFWALIFFMTPFSILASFLALFNIMPVEFNNKPYYGVVGFIIPLLYTPLASILFSCAIWGILNIGGFLHDVFLKLTKKKTK